MLKLENPNVAPQCVPASLGPIIQCVNCLGADVIISQYSSGGSPAYFLLWMLLNIEVSLRLAFALGNFT